MDRSWRQRLIVAAVVLQALAAASTHAESVRSGAFSADMSTQYLYGDDWMGNAQNIVSQYVNVKYAPQGAKYSIAGYGRATKDLSNDTILRDTDTLGRLYYLYLDYAASDTLSFRLGRQLVNMTADSATIDGVTAQLTKVAPVGVTVSAGRDVEWGVDRESTRVGNYVLGVDLHLEGVKNVQLNAGYFQKYVENDLARELLAVSGRYTLSPASFYARTKYDLVRALTSELLVGADIAPSSKFSAKAEYYQSYPTFDTTSVYSVFAVDRYRELLVQGDYQINEPVWINASYTHQSYDDDAEADVVTAGMRAHVTEELALKLSVSRRSGYPSKGMGAEVSGDFKASKKLVVSAGIRQDTYMRPDDSGYQNASQYWIGARYVASKRLSASLRFEENNNDHFNHRALGRATLDYSF